MVPEQFKTSQLNPSETMCTEVLATAGKVNFEPWSTDDKPAAEYTGPEIT